jgi:predicted alpha/beta-hydrolase family hydrolase
MSASNRRRQASTKTEPRHDDERGENEGDVVEPSPRHQELTIPLPEPLGGVKELSAVLGVPEWWPTGARVAVAFAHGSASDMNDPVIVELHRRLAESKCLTLRFNFPFGELGKRSRTDSPDVMDRAFRAALSVFGRDATQAPAHLILVGKGTGALVAAKLATSRLPIGGLAFLGYPLHPQGKPENVDADSLYRIAAPMLFLQGTRDRRCNVDTLRRTLGRVGAPTTLQVIDDADKDFKVPKRSLRRTEDVQGEVYASLRGWLSRVIGEL